jgi:hypothetical protein
MGAPRVPTHILKARGSLDRVTGTNAAILRARREGEPTPRGELGAPPESMPDNVVECWKEVVKLAHFGTICDSDALIVEELSYLLFRCRENQFNVAPAILARFEKCLACLGLTPADRSRVSVDKSKLKQADPFDEFTAHGNA